MRITSPITVLLLAMIGPAEIHAQSASTFTARVESAVDVMTAGGFHWHTRYFSFPIGCSYLSHDFSIIEQVPPLDTDLPPLLSIVRDRLQRDKNDRVIALSIKVGAHRPFFGSDGPASIKVQVNVVAECTDGAAQELAKQFE